jgi:glycosyltransferase involved in cell wall biosynthesis
MRTRRHGALRLTATLQGRSRALRYVSPVPRPLRVLTTLFVRDLPEDCAWRRHSDLIHPSDGSLPGRLWRLVQLAPRYDVVVLNGSSRPDQLAAILLRRLRPSVPIVITDCQWKLETSRLARAITRAGLFLIDGPRTYYTVLSTEDQRNFPASWGVDAERVLTSYWFPAISEEEARAPTSDGGYVFSGGDSMRDYRALVEAASSVPFEVRIATRLPPPIPEGELPPNLTYGPLDQDDYLRDLCNASAVVVALQAGTPRSAGQTTYQVARGLGKLVIVNDATGVREYVEDGKTGLVVPSGDARALAEALRWALEPANGAKVREIAANGKQAVFGRFSKVAYVDGILDVARLAAGIAPSDGS